MNENVEEALDAVIAILKRVGEIATDDNRVQEVINCEHKLAYIHWRADLIMRALEAYKPQLRRYGWPKQEIAQ